jgi:hypothetical protein
LCDKFPRVFSISLQKEMLVSEVGVLDVDRRVWNLSWRRRLFQWEEESVSHLLASLENVVLSVDDDCWGWKLEVDGVFSVKSTYEFLSRSFGDPSTLSPMELKILANIWVSPAPSKLVVFSWELLLGRLPTRDNLISRRVLSSQDEGGCVWCNGVRESPSHLFQHCSVAHVVWYEIFRWLGIRIVIPQNLFSLFDWLCGEAKNKKVRKCFMLI